MIAVLFAVITGIGTQSDSISAQAVVVITSGIAGSALAALYELIDTHGQGFKLWYQSNIKYKNAYIRLSFSYLYRIEVNGKFLMVKGNRLKNQYQPVGGVYKFYDEAREFLNSIQFIPDIEMGNSDETDDLRIRIKGKYLLKFIDWFLEMKNREYCPTREFREELVDSNILSLDLFNHIKYRKVYVHNKGLTYSEYFQCNEWIYADIFELKLTKEQKNAINQAVLQYPDVLCLASVEEVQKLRYNGSVERNIGNNARWILGE